MFQCHFISSFLLGTCSDLFKEFIQRSIYLLLKNTKCCEDLRKCVVNIQYLNSSGILLCKINKQTETVQHAFHALDPGWIPGTTRYILSNTVKTQQCHILTWLYAHEHYLGKPFSHPFTPKKTQLHDI